MNSVQQNLKFGVAPQVAALLSRLSRHFLSRDVGDELRYGDEDALVVGIFGPWGSGKTHWLRHLHRHHEQELEVALKADIEAGVRGITVPVFFNAWRFEREPHLVVPMLKTAELAVRQAADRAIRMTPAALALSTPRGIRFWATPTKPAESHWLYRSAQRLGDAAIAVGAGLSAKLTLPGIAELTFAPEKMLTEERRRLVERETAAGKVPPLLLAKYESMYFDLHGHLRELMGRNRSPNEKRPALNLLFLIDDLDRCLPDKAVEVVEAIKLFLEVEGTAFVLALDDEVIERGIAHRYRDYDSDDSGRPSPITGAEYLEKIVHLPIRVPPISETDARSFLLERYRPLFVFVAATATPTSRPEEVLDHKLLDLIVRAVPGVPRKLIRAAELLALTQEVAAQCMPGHRRHLLARLVILQLFAPEVYRLGAGRFSAEYMRYLVEWRNKSLENLRAQLDPREAKGSSDEIELARLRWERVQRPLLDALSRALSRRTGFDPRDVIEDGQTAQSDEFSLESVRDHHRLVEAGALHSAVSVATRSAQTGMPPAIEVSARPRDLEAFLSYAVSANPRDWLSALAAEREEMTGRTLDHETFVEILARASRQPAHISLSWLENFEPHLSWEQLASLYRETRVLDRMAQSQLSAHEPSNLRGALELLCRKLNPAHEPVVKPVKISELSEERLDLSQGEWRGAYLRGLQLRGARLPTQPEGWAGAHLQGAELPPLAETERKSFDGADLRDAQLRPDSGAPEALIHAQRLAPQLAPTGKLGELAALRGGQLLAITDAGHLALVDFHASSIRLVSRMEEKARALCVLDEATFAVATSSCIEIRSIASGARLYTLLQRAAIGLCALGSNRLAVGTHGSEVFAWNWKTRECLPHHQIEFGPAGGALCSIDDDRVAFAASDQSIRVWNVNQSEVDFALLGGTERPTLLTLLNSTYLASASIVGEVRLWELEDRRAHQLYGTEDPAPTVLHGFADNRVLCGSHTLRIWNGSTGELEHQLAARARAGKALDHRRLAVLDEQGVAVWDLHSAVQVDRLETHGERVQDVCALANGGLASSSGHVWSLKSGRFVRYRPERAGQCLVEWRPNCVAVGSSDSHVHLLDSDGTDESQLAGLNAAVTSLCPLPGNRIAAGSETGSVVVWDVTSTQPIVELDAHRQRVTSIAMIDERRMVTGSYDGTACVWDVTSSALLATLPSQGGFVARVCVLDSTRVATASRSDVHIWDVTTGTVLETLQMESRRLVSTLVAPQPNILVAGTYLGQICVWNLSTGLPPTVIESRVGIHKLCRVSATRLAAIHSDQTIRVWDLENGVCSTVYAVHGPVLVTIERERGITCLRADRGFITHNVNGQHLPADPQLYKLVGLSAADGVSGRRYSIPLHAAPPDPSGPWQWLDDSHRTLHLPWPSDPELREIAFSPWFDC